MQVLDLAVVGEYVLEIFFGCFFVHIGGDYDPSLDTAHRSRAVLCSWVGARWSVVFFGVSIDFHGGVCHCDELMCRESECKCDNNESVGRFGVGDGFPDKYGFGRRALGNRQLRQ